MFGHSLLIPLPDLDRTDFHIIFGANPLVSNGSMMTAPGVGKRLKAIQQRGGQLVVVDPRRTETAKIADLHLFIRPGTDVFMLLAMLHVVFTHNNYIGTTPQLNRHSDNWVEFWRDCRLKPQLTMAQAAGFRSRLIDRGERLLACMDQLMQDHEPAASLLHGDLWAGNKAYTPAGKPVIFDPAAYFGDRETDIAMTELFGGFDPEFYAAYQAHSPLPDGYPLRRDLYKLYHVLNHLNLFGTAYLSRSENIVDGLLAHIS